MAKNPRIIWQDKITKEMGSAVGERAVSLSRLDELEIRTPKFFAISTDAFNEFFANVKAEVERELEDLGDDFSSAKRVSSNIKSILSHNQISEPFQEELFQAYKEMSNSDSYSEIPSRAMELIKSGREMAPLTVRLSPQQHLIHFDEVKNVIGITALINTVRELWTRIFSAKSLYYMFKNNLSYHEHLPAILVHKTVQASKSGDLFSVNPLTNNNEQAYLQVIWGMIGDNFNNPSTFVVDKSTKQVSQSNITRQPTYLAKKSQVANIEQQQLPEELQTKAPLSRPELEKLIEVAVKLESQFKFPQHIGWIIGKEIIVTGAEPITNSFKKPLHFKAEEAESGARGIPLVAKEFNGKIAKPDPNIISNIRGNQVLVLDKSNDMLFEAMLNSAGVISQSSGLSSHLAINCREFSIPSLISVKDAGSLLNENQEIETRNGNIIIKEQEPEPKSEPKNNTLEMPSFLQKPEASQRERQIPEREEVTSVVDSAIDLDTSLDSEISLSEMISKLTELEKYITNKVYEEAEKRKSGFEVDEQEQKKIRLMQELEWDIRNIKKKLNELL